METLERISSMVLDGVSFKFDYSGALGADPYDELNDNECILKVSGLGKFGRALATVHVTTLTPTPGESSITLINVNQQLIVEGHAEEYHGGKR